MDGGGKIAMDGGSGIGYTTAQWAAGQQSNCNGQQGGGGTVDGTMGGRQLPVDEGKILGAMLGFWLVGVR